MKKLRDFRDPKRDRPLSFWGPAGIGLGITLLLNDVQINTESISLELRSGTATLLFALGILLIVWGLLALYLITQERKVALARVGLATGLLIFFWGTRVFDVLYKTNPPVGFGVGWAGIIVGLVLIVTGYLWAPK